MVFAQIAIFTINNHNELILILITILEFNNGTFTQKPKHQTTTKKVQNSH